jgi:hypothetical protein
MLKKTINNLIAIPSLFLFIHRCYSQQEQYLKETLLLDLKKKNEDIAASLTSKDYQKITFYYGLAVPVIGEVLGILKGTTITLSERKTLTYLGGLTGLFDDLFDEEGASEEHIKELLNNPKAETCNSSTEKLVVQFYLKALEQEHSKRIKKTANLVYDAQVLSKKQTSGQLSAEEILQITQQKGGASILFYRSGLDGEINDLESDLLFNIGLLGQLENDIFDIYKDSQQQISTLATTSTSMFALRMQYQSILNEIYALIEQTDFEKKNQLKFSRLIATIASRGLVALDQLIEIQGKEKFAISNCTRVQLICDMGKLKNIIKWIGYYLRWNIN